MPVITQSTERQEDGNEVNLMTQSENLITIGLNFKNAVKQNLVYILEADSYPEIPKSLIKERFVLGSGWVCGWSSLLRSVPFKKYKSI